MRTLATQAAQTIDRIPLNIRNEVEVRTGKLQIIENEIMREDIPICGIVETHWKRNGHFGKATQTIHIAGATESDRNGMTILVDKKYTNNAEIISLLGNRNRI